MQDSQDLYRAPTMDEMHELHDTMELYKSNLFKLQMDELLEKIKLKKSGSLESLLFEIKSALDTSKDWESLSFEESKQRLVSSHQIQIPFPDSYIFKDIQFKLGYSKPSAIHVVGSFLLETLVNNPSNVHADLAIQMPKSLFQEKDYTNYRYSLKRAHYLAVVASILKDQLEDCQISFEAFQGDLRRSILIVSMGNVFVRIFPSITSDYFNLNKLAPAKNNVRCASQPPTPYYNALILLDTCFVSHMNFLYHHASTTKHFRDAVMLGKVWIHQRFPYARGFNGFVFSMLMAYLLESTDGQGIKRLSSDFSSYQLFKITMNFIATHDFKSDPVFMSGNAAEGNDFSKEAFVKHYDAVIVDPSGKINLGSCMSQCQLNELQYEAKLAMDLLQQDSQDAFEGLFLRKIALNHLKFDQFARISGDDLSLPAYSEAAQVDYPSARIFSLHYIPKVIKKALKDRVKLVSMNSSALGSWSIDSEPPKDTGLEIYLGFILNPEVAFNPIEFGPSPNDKSASDDFKRLWGESAEVRRYQDGSIKDSVVISYSEGQDKGLVMQKFISILLKRHMGLTLEEGIQYYSCPMSFALKAPGLQALVPSFKNVNEAFVELSKHLKSLRELPLSIVNVYPSHPGLYQSSVFVPQPQPNQVDFANGYRPFLEHMDVVLEFETSGYWPDHLPKLQQMKLAFYLEIAKRLKAISPDIHAQVNVGMRRHVMDSGFLDIVTSNGFKFRVRIHVEREKYLLEKVEKSKIPQAWSFYETVFVKRPRHALHMQNLCFSYPFLSDTIRLVKRWTSTHLLSGHIPHEWLETCCVAVFRNALPWSPPSSSFCGFGRVLALFAFHDWKSEPLIVEMESGKMTTEAKNQIQKYFSLRQDPVFVATEYDLDASCWPSLDKVILQRLNMLSKTCLELIAQKTLSADAKWIKTLFYSSLMGYDCILKLDPSKCSRFRENLTFDPKCLHLSKPKYRNLITPQDRESALLSRIDTVACLLTDLKKAFGDVAYFFYDEFGGDVIAIVWKFKKDNLPWKVNLKYNCQVVNGKDGQQAKKKQRTDCLLKPHYDAMLSEMQRLGQGLIVGIQNME